jgi:hypothetical protein
MSAVRFALDGLFCLFGSGVASLASVQDATHALKAVQGRWHSHGDQRVLRRNQILMRPAARTEDLK